MNSDRNEQNCAILIGGGPLSVLHSDSNGNLFPQHALPLPTSSESRERVLGKLGINLSTCADAANRAASGGFASHRQCFVPCGHVPPRGPV